MQQTLNLCDVGSTPSAGTNFNASISQQEDHALLRRISRGSSGWKYHFLAVAVGSNPTWAERQCQARKAMRLVSTARFFKHPTTPFVLVVSTPSGIGGEAGSSPARLKLIWCMCVWHRALVGRCHVRKWQQNRNIHITALGADMSSWVRLPLWR